MGKFLRTMFSQMWDDFIVHGFFHFLGKSEGEEGSGLRAFAEILVDRQFKGEGILEGLGVLHSGLQNDGEDGENPLERLGKWYDDLTPKKQDQFERAVGRFYRACKDGVVAARIITRIIPSKEKGGKAIEERHPEWDTGYKPSDVFINFWKFAISQGDDGLNRAVKMILQSSRWSLMWDALTGAWRRFLETGIPIASWQLLKKAMRASLFGFIGMVVITGLFALSAGMSVAFGDAAGMERFAAWSTVSWVVFTTILLLLLSVIAVPVFRLMGISSSRKTWMRVIFFTLITGVLVALYMLGTNLSVSSSAAGVAILSILLLILASLRRILLGESSKVLMRIGVILLLITAPVLVWGAVMDAQFWLQTELPQVGTDQNFDPVSGEPRVMVNEKLERFPIHYRFDPVTGKELREADPEKDGAELAKPPPSERVAAVEQPSPYGSWTIRLSPRRFSTPIDVPKGTTMDITTVDPDLPVVVEGRDVDTGRWVGLSSPGGKDEHLNMGAMDQIRIKSVGRPGEALVVVSPS